MKKILAGLAAGALTTSLMVTSAAYALDDDMVADKTPAPENVIQIPQRAAERLTEACSLYSFVLNQVDQHHISGKTQTDHAVIAKAALREMLRVNFEYHSRQNSDLDIALEYETVDGEDVISALRIDDKVINVTPMTTAAGTYSDHCSYLGATAKEIQELTGTDILRSVEYAVNGALKASRGDVHTSYRWIDENDRSMDALQGNFVGIGVTIEQDDNGRTVITQTFSDSPAERAGIQADDVISAIDGQSVDGLDLQGISNLLRGQRHTDVEIEITRDGRQPFTVTVTRDQVRVDPITSRIIGEHNDTAYLRISTFSHGTADSLHEHLDKIAAEQGKNGTPIRNIVIDVRGNGGGLLDDALKISDTFIPSGGDPDKKILHTAGGAGGTRSYYADTLSPFTVQGVNVIILQDGGSASASEVVAGALQDNGHIVIGQYSFGKGSVQIQRPVGNPRNPSPYGQLKITVSMFYPGDGLSNQVSGVIPNIKVEFNDFRDDQDKERRREGSLNNNSLIPLEKTRDGQTPDKICSLKTEFSGYLSPEAREQLPEHLQMRVRNHENPTRTSHVIDADLACTFHYLNGDDTYTTIRKFAP